MPAKSYIWGRISGVLSILTGVFWVLNFSPAPHLDLVVHLSMSTLFVVGGVLVLLKKSLEWYLMYLHLFLVGSMLLYFAAGSVEWYLGDRWTLTEIIGIQVDSNPLPVISAVAAIGIGCYLLLWVQIRYWNRRKADV